MQVTAITKFKHGPLLRAIRESGLTQAKLAKLIGIARPNFSKILSLQVRPRRSTANRIQRAFAKLGIYIDVLESWPIGTSLPRGFSVEQTKDISCLLDGETPLVDSYDPSFDQVVDIIVGRLPLSHRNGFIRWVYAKKDYGCRPILAAPSHTMGRTLRIIQQDPVAMRAINELRS